MTNPWIALTMLCMGTISSCTPAKDQAEADYADDLDVVILNGRAMDPETDFDAVRNVRVLLTGYTHWLGSNSLGSMDIWSRRPVSNTGKRIGLPGKTFCTTESFTTTTPFTNT